MLKLSKRQQGFTLVELLVAIAIIAILAVIGLTVFTGLQRGARDATRRADVLSVSKALEANYQTTTALYPPLLGTMFAGGTFPQDPLHASAAGCAGAYCGYCVGWSVAGGTAPVGTLVGAGGADCSTVGAGGEDGVSFSRATSAVPPGAVPAATATGYIVCANLEAAGTGQFYCQGNQR